MRYMSSMMVSVTGAGGRTGGRTVAKKSDWTPPQIMEYGITSVSVPWVDNLKQDMCAMLLS